MKIKVTLLLLLPFIGLCQPKPLTDNELLPKSNVFILGEVLVNSKKKDTLNSISSKTMESQNKMDVSRALNLLPGVSLTAFGARNESMVSIRGFDLRQVPVYMDGIPVYVPYDGYVDLARFTTSDLASIDVSKGFSSIVYGPNSLGGAINLVSRKPIKKFEFDGALGLIDTDGQKSNLNIGANLGEFYIQGGFSYLDRKSYQMSKHFVQLKNEDGGARDNSYRTDQKATLKIGWMPSKNSEYALGYINQKGEKGNPAYAGYDIKNSLLAKPRYWQWPTWDKESIYLLSNTKIDENNSFKTRWYYDKFKNLLNSYDDATYTKISKPYAFQSFYDDYTYGANLEYETKFIPKNDLKFAVQFKQDVHREHNEGEPVRRFEDQTITLGLEDVFKVTEKLTVIPGISYNSRENNKAEDYNSNTKVISDYADVKKSEAVNLQVGLFYKLTQVQKIGATVSRKTRFATIKDRYSYSMGTAIPNPNLKPETALNYEVNYDIQFFKKLKFQTALFYSSLTDAILSVSNVQPGKLQKQNFGEAEYKGFEAQLSYSPIQKLNISANYTYLERKNSSNPEINFTDVPNTKVMATIEYSPLKVLKLIGQTEINSSRYSTSYGVKTPQFTLVNAFISAKLLSHFSIDTGLNNTFDRNYSIAEGYPEEGRNFFVNLRFYN